MIDEIELLRQHQVLLRDRRFDEADDLIQRIKRVPNIVRVNRNRVYAQVYNRVSEKLERTLTLRQIPSSYLKVIELATFGSTTPADVFSQSRHGEYFTHLLNIYDMINRGARYPDVFDWIVVPLLKDPAVVAGIEADPATFRDLPKKRK